MIALMQSLSAFAGLVSMVLLLVVAIVAGKYMAKSNVNAVTSDAQKSAIEAMNVEISVLRAKIDDIKKDNAEIKKENERLQSIMETISAALKGMDLIVTLEGEMVRIRDSNNNSTTTRIHGTGWQ
jgi:cell division protein FtsB